MSLSVTVGRKQLTIGSASLLKAFFSTVYVRLERESWGSRFPIVMRELYAGALRADSATGARKELDQMRIELESLQPQDVVWDFEDRSAEPPWGTRISPSITSLATYFVTSEGKNLFEVLSTALLLSAESGIDLAIE